MPPSSRKRNKGKDRKAKQLAKKEETERMRLRTIWRRCCSINNTGCDHGCVIIQSDNHPVLSFIDQCCLYLGEKCMLVSKALRELFKSHPQIWNDESYKKSAIGILVRIGTNMMIKIGTGADADITVPICLAQSIIALEHYNGEDDIDLAMNKRVVISKWRDLNFTSSSRRDTLKFYRERTSCKCLKKMHLEARKTMPKVGICEYCKEEKERVLLDVCSRCKVSQYCSRQCQIAAWHEHKMFCVCHFCDE